jgi:hypothetical protein
MLRKASRLCVVAAVLGAGLLAAACSGRIKNGPPQAPSGPVGKPDFTLSSKEFDKEFTDNVSSALNKYKDKVVELNGKVMAPLYDEGDGKPSLYLEGAKPQNEGGTWVLCQMADKYPWAKVNGGQTLTVKGKAHPAFARQLVNCEIIKVEGEPARRMTAEEFARRAADPKLQEEQKKGPKQFVVSGEIDRHDGQAFKTGLYLKTQTGKGVLIQFKEADYRRLKVADWKPGQKIEVLGGDSSNPGNPWLVNCLPMSDPK